MSIVPATPNTDNGTAYGPMAPYQPHYPQQMQPDLSEASFSRWIRDARELAPIAESLSRTSFVPKAFFGKPAEVTAAILAGQEVGMPAMAALRSIDVIEGKPGMSAIALRALIQSHGHEIWVEESTATRAIVKGRRKGAAREERSVWTLDRARQLGLTNKSNWKNQPTNMLLARATSECARLVAADVILGMPYSAEELRDGLDGIDESNSEGAPEAEEKPVRRTAKRKPLERAEGAEPPLPPAQATIERQEQRAEEPVSAPPAVDGMAESQQRRMFAMFREANIVEKEHQLQYIAEVIGRTIESRKELTAVEGSQIIDSLAAIIPAQGEPSGGED